MESGEIADSPFSIEEDEQPSEYPLSDILDELCSYYMVMGVSYEDFWYGDFTRLKYYARAYDLQRKAQNEWLWLQGSYIDNAIATELSNFGSKKGTTPRKYIQKPIDVIPKTDRELKEERKKEKQKAIDFFMNLIPQNKK